MKRITLLFLLVSLLLSCTKDNDIVDSTLQRYLDDFQDEASKRGFKVNYETKKIEARLELHDNNANLGWCTYNSDRPNAITINSIYWDVLNALEKEKLIFHELGHCVLNRPHYDVTRTDGKCISIMHSGQACSDDYNETSRSRYLDELFFR
ncbi:MAG: hypothetical protein HKN76_12355 [Saprospiraceae bacterium]|nr:hypothetical protein [Saprospiraceae bacterium]